MSSPVHIGAPPPLKVTVGAGSTVTLTTELFTSQVCPLKVANVTLLKSVVVVTDEGVYAIEFVPEIAVKLVTDVLLCHW